MQPGAAGLGALGASSAEWEAAMRRAGLPRGAGRAALAVLAAGWLLGLSPAVRRQLALVPAKVVPRIWMLATAGVVETNFLALVVDAAAAVFTAAVLEPAWGAQEWAVVAGVSSAGGFALTSLTLLLLFGFSGAAGAAGAARLIYRPIGGFSGAAAGLLVGVKQVAPERTLGFGAARFPARHLPAGVVGLSLALVAARILPPWRFCIVLYGALSGWFYLRYLQQRPDDDVRGDPSREFSLGSFIPIRAVGEGVDAAVADLESRVPGMLERGALPLPVSTRGAGVAGVGPAEERAGAGGSSTGSAAKGSGKEDEEAQRRRERGRRALAESLARKAEEKARVGGQGGGSAARPQPSSASDLPETTAPSAPEETKEEP